MSAQSGQLILLSDKSTENVIYECQLNGSLQVGSEKNAANVCLSGLKNVAFSIFIDHFGRACISFRMKKIQINGKRVPKNAVRPLVNNTAIEAGAHKFIWKYASKCTRSYSLSPCKRSEREVDMFIRNRKTINCFTIDQLNDENAANGEEETNNDQKSVPVPVIKSENVKNSTKRRTSLIPVKPNRTSELRRSIVRSKSVSHEPFLIQHKTPKRPVPSSIMAKSVNAIIRSESRMGECQSSQATRKSLGANINLPNIIDGMNLFNVVTNEMKAVGPSVYNSAKFGATNSPKRTPKKALIKPKRLSLRSELTEMAIMRTNGLELAILSEDQKQLEVNATLPSTPEKLPSAAVENVEFLSTPQADVSLEMSSEANATSKGSPELNATFTSTEVTDATLPNTSQAKIVESNTSQPIEKEQTSSSSVDREDAALINTPGTHTEDCNTPQPKRLTSSSSVDREDAALINTPDTRTGDCNTPQSKRLTSSSSVDREDAALINTPDTRTGECNTPQSKRLTSSSSVDRDDAALINTPDTRTEDCNTPQSKRLTSSSSVDREDATLINTPGTHTEDRNTPQPKRLTSSSSVEIIDDSVEFCLVVDDDEDDESSDSEYSIISVDDDSEVVESETSPEVIASTLTTMKSESSLVTDKSIATEANCEEIDQADEPQPNATPEVSFEKSVSEPVLSSVSTPIKVLPIRARRNSRLCSLDECCSPSAAFTTPTKSKMSNNVASTPRSILKTPKATKTPKKSVRIAESVLQEVYEEEDDVPITDAQTSVKDQSVPEYQNATATEPLEISVGANDVQPESKSVDENDDPFTPIKNAPGSPNSVNGKCDSEIILLAESNLSPQPNNVFVGTTTYVPKPEIIETATGVSMPIFSAEAKLSDDVTDAIDKVANVSGQCDHLVDANNVTKEGSCNISKDEREETNLFDETFEIQSQSQDNNQTLSMSVSDENNHFEDLTGVRALLKTPKVLDKTNLVGIKELLQTPSDGPSRSEDMRGIKELMNTPKALDKTNLVGMKELLHTPTDGPSRSEDMRGIKELMNTPKALDKTNLVGMKELLHTPTDGPSRSEDMRGIKELMNTPKALDKTNLVGMKELLHTPTDGLSRSEDMRGIKELMNTPKALDKTNLTGMKELLNTPDNFNKSVDMRGVRELMKTPKMQDITNLIGVKELLKTPHNPDESKDVDELLKSPIVPDEQNQPADKKYCLNLRYNSRNSLINLVNNQMHLIGFPAITEEELQPVEAVAAPVAVEPIAVSVPAEQMVAQAAIEPMAEKAAVEPMAEKAAVEPLAEKAAVEPMAEKAAVEAEKVAPVEAIAAPKPVDQIVPQVEPEEVHSLQEVPLISDAELNVKTTIDSRALNSENDQSLKVEPISRPVPKEVEINIEPTKTGPKNTKTPRKTRNRQASAIELQESDEETASENVEAKEAAAKSSKATKTVTSKAEPKVSKTPSRTRKRKASEVEPKDETVPENDEATEPVTLIVEPKVSKAPAKTRKGKASVVESQDENVSERDEALGATKRVTSSTESKTAKTPLRARKRKLSVADVPKSQDDKVSEIDEASEATHVELKTESNTTKTPSKSRKRKATVVALPESQNETSSKSGEAIKAEPKVARTRARKASIFVNYQEAGPSTSEAEVPKTRRRKADQVETVKAEEENVFEQVEIEPSTESKKRQASAVEPPESHEKVAKTRKRKASYSENSRSAANKSSASSSSEFKHPKKRQRQVNDTDQLDSQDEIVSESSQVTEPTDSEPVIVDAVAAKPRKRTVRKDPPTKATRSTRSAQNEGTSKVEPAPEVIEKPTRTTSKRTRQMSVSVSNESRTKKVAPKPKEDDTKNKAAKVTRSRKASEAETAILSQEATPSTATRSTRRGQTIKAAVSVVEKRPRRGKN